MVDVFFETRFLDMTATVSSNAAWGKNNNDFGSYNDEV